MRYSQQRVRIAEGMAPSGHALRERLEEMDYTGRSINWGHTKYEGINSPEAIKLASHKKNALRTFVDCGVPTPEVWDTYGAQEVIDEIPLIGRPNYHTKNSDFWYCETLSQVHDAIDDGATHFLEYIKGAREFRVHIVAGQSIKISEKHKSYNIDTGGFEEGSWTYPEQFRRKISLRHIAKDAVNALGLDFGAVDILYKKINGEPKFFVLEVNTAPCLTESDDNDTLRRYAEAFHANF